MSNKPTGNIENVDQIAKSFLKLNLKEKNNQNSGSLKNALFLDTNSVNLTNTFQSQRNLPIKKNTKNVTEKTRKTQSKNDQITINRPPIYQQSPFLPPAAFNRLYPSQFPQLEDITLLKDFDYKQEWDFSTQKSQTEENKCSKDNGTKEDLNKTNGALDMLSLDEILGDKDEKLQKSKFVKFLREVKSGNLKITENEVIDMKKDNISDKNFIGEKKEKFVHFYKFKEPKEILKTEKVIDIESIYKESVRLMKQGRLSKAIEGFEAVASRRPEWEEVWILLGKCSAENEDDESALSAFDTCLAINLENKRALLLSAQAHLNDNNSTLALSRLHLLKDVFKKEFNIVEPIRKDNEKTKNVFDFDSSKDMYTDFFYDREIAWNLIEFFRNGSETYPDQFLFHEALAVLNGVVGKYADAADNYRSVLKFGSSDPTLWNRLGASLANARCYNEAIEAYEKSLEIRPNYVRALTNKGISYHNKKEYMNAAGCFVKALDLNEKADGIWSLLSSSVFKIPGDQLSEKVRKRDLEGLKGEFKAYSK